MLMKITFLKKIEALTVQSIVAPIVISIIRKTFVYDMKSSYKNISKIRDVTFIFLNQKIFKKLK